MNRKRVGILIFPAVEVLDFCGPFEVFSATRLDEERRRQDLSPFEVVLVSETAGVTVATGGLKVVADCTLDDCPLLEILIVPGGWGTRTEVRNDRLVRWIARQGRQVETLASVCTGAMLLAQAGLLDDRRATTHAKALEELRGLFPRVTFDADQRVVEQGNILTSAGIAAGIDLALRIVAREHGEDVARATARHMEYPYPELDRGRS